MTFRLLFSQIVWINSFVVLALALTLQLPARALAQTPPIPKFAIQYWDVPGRTGSIYMNDMNDFGQIAGGYKDALGEDRPFFYSPMISRTTAFDLEDLYGNEGIPDGWKYKTAYQINDNGVILGALTTVDPNIQSPVTGKRPEQGFIIDTWSDAPKVILLPVLEGIAQYRPIKLNNDGDMVGLYWAEDGTTGKFFFNPDEHDNLTRLDPIVSTVNIGERINGFPIIGGQCEPRGSTVYRYVPGLGSMTILSNITSVYFINDMNDVGNFAGMHQAGPKAMRIIGNQVQTLSPQNQSANDINNSNDVLLSGGNLFRDDRGTILIKSYLSGTKADLALWNSSSFIWTSKLNNRNTVTKYGQIAGDLTIPVNGGSTRQQPFLLTPVAKR